MNIIILGQQGCGKGTQADVISKKYSLIHVDMGKTLREVAKSTTQLGREIYEIQNVTKTLVPSRILKEVLHIKLNSIPINQGIVFDGVPRTLDQAGYIEEALKEFGRRIDKVFFVNISESESIRRISKRWMCSGCKRTLIMGKDVQNELAGCPECNGEIIQRIDDTIEGIKKRLQVFKLETVPVLNKYATENLLKKIDGEQSIEDVFSEIDGELNNLQ